MPGNWNTIVGGTAIQPGATIRRKPADDGWESHKFLDTADVSEVAVTGDYEDLTNKPYIPPEAQVDSVNGHTGVVVLSASDVGADASGDAAQALSDANDYTDGEISDLAEVATTGDYEDLGNKPHIPLDAPVDSVNGKIGVVVLDASDVNADASGSADQALNDSKDYTDDEISSLATVASTGDYGDLANKPTIPSVPVQSVNTKTGNVILDYTDVGADELGSAAEALDSSIAYTDGEINSLAAVASTGSYNDLANKPTIPTLPTYGQTTPSRSLNGIFRPSTTRNVLGSYSVRVNTTASLTGGQEGLVHLEISSVSDFSTDVTTISTVGNRNSVSLAIALTANQDTIQTLVGTIPIGYYVRLRTQQVTGTPTFSFVRCQETTI